MPTDLHLIFVKSLGGQQTPLLITVIAVTAVLFTEFIDTHQYILKIIIAKNYLNTVES
jgi:hypothetical protein